MELPSSPPSTKKKNKRLVLTPKRRSKKTQELVSRCILHHANSGASAQNLKLRKFSQNALDKVKNARWVNLFLNSLKAGCLIFDIIVVLFFYFLNFLRTFLGESATNPPLAWVRGKKMLRIYNRASSSPYPRKKETLVKDFRAAHDARVYSLIYRRA